MTEKTKYNITNGIGLLIHVASLGMVGWILFGMFLAAFKSTAPFTALAMMALLMIAPSFIKSHVKDLVETVKLMKSLNKSEPENE